jgi:hypothetical protein
MGKELARDQFVGYLPGFPDAAGQSSIMVLTVLAADALSKIMCHSPHYDVENDTLS